MLKLFQYIAAGLRFNELSQYHPQFRLDSHPESFSRRIAFDYIHFRQSNIILNVVIISIGIIIFSPSLPLQWVLFCALCLLMVEAMSCWMAGKAILELQEGYFNHVFWGRFKYFFNVIQFTSLNIPIIISIYLVHPNLLIGLEAAWLILIIYGSSLNFFSYKFNLLTTSVQIGLFLFVVFSRFEHLPNNNEYTPSSGVFLLPATLAFLASYAVALFFRKHYLAGLIKERNFNLANAQLRESHILIENEKKHAEQIYNSLSEAVIVADADFNIHFHNKAFSEIFEIPSTENLMKLSSYVKDRKLLNPDDVKRSLEFNGKHFIMQGKPLIHDGDEALNVFVVIDVTDKVRADESAVQSQKLNALGSLTGGIAHDFNNFLAVILSNAELIQYSDDLDEIKEYVSDIIAASNSASGLTKRILSSVRRMPLRNEPIIIKDAINGILRLVRNSLEPYHWLVVKIDTNKTIIGDQVLLENAILNLILNAHDAMEKGGEIQIKVFDEGDYVVFSVEDQGEGIAPEMLKKVMEPFFTLKQNEKGTGIGLSMVKQFAKRSGGRFEFESELNKGTKAKIYLPYRPPGVLIKDRQITKSQKIIEKDANQLSVLIVDDNEALTRSLALQVEQFGHEVEIACSLGDVTALADISHFDVVLCDVVLKRESGIEVWEYFQENHAGAKFIFISGNVPPKMMQRLQAIGADVVLNKPLRASELQSSIAKRKAK